MRSSEPAPLRLRLEARLENILRLRERVRAWLEDAGANPRETFEMLLATTEAFTNAVEHPQGPCCHAIDVEVSIDDDAVVVSIRDYGTWDGKESRKEDGGLGLELMDELMDEVEVETVPEGTTVTMRRSLPPH
jgi:anti-sigma regulatory factor (Ser/Thr protein kinase)